MKQDWSYYGQNGPSHWGSICPLYEVADTGDFQSPIAIETLCVNDEVQNIYFVYQEDVFQMEYARYTFQLYPSKKQVLIYNDIVYNLQHVHAHTPSEHLINQKRYDTEWHFVHEDKDGNLLVLAILAQGMHVATSLYETAIVWNPCDLLQEDLGYYQYMGSLTTPPTKENVLWLVQGKIHEESLQERRLCGSIVGENARPLQQIHNRKITHIIKK